VRRLIVLHSNDIHGRLEALARIATLVERTRAEADGDAVLYVDAGDVEDTTERLSNLTKGVALHRLLRVAGCQAVAVGNGTVIRYGVEPLVGQAAAGGYPHLAANLWLGGTVVPGTQARALLDVGGIGVGLIGLTPIDWPDLYAGAFGVELPDALPLVREHMVALRQEGADVIILLSHLGIDRDRELAAELEGGLPLIVGSHSHTLLPEGEQIGSVTIVQAGQFGDHLGRVDLVLEDGAVRVEQAALQPVTSSTPAHPAVASELATIEDELAEWLAEVVGEVAEPLDLAYDSECAATNYMADIVRERMAAELAVVTTVVAFDAPLPEGPLSRGALYEACSSPGVSSVATLTGAQLTELVRRGLDPELAADQPRSMRGRARGLMHLSGGEVRDGRLWVAGEPVADARDYRVAGSDWELGNYGGYALPEWGLEVEFDGTTIMREAVEEHLHRYPVIERPELRLHGSL
jgi:2',3'-cyclic-nucleotide 2'-phosphodiesterase (5'-nucleotidase family)